MSIKKLFDGKLNDALVSTNLEEEIVKTAPELESADNFREQVKLRERFVPQVDFGDPRNFVAYGSAKQYYEDAVNRITNQYPYDGSEEEVTKFLNESNYLDLHVLENNYPRTTGYIKIGTGQTFDSDPATSNELLSWGVVSSGEEYIKVIGGPHTASNGMPTGSLHTKFTGSNYYDTDIYETDGTLALDRVGTRESNLKYNTSKGVTTEFWLKKEGFSVGDTCKEVIMDLWNGEASSSAQYGRFLLYLTGAGVAETGLNPLRLHMASGSTVIDTSLFSSGISTSSIADSNWHHYAVAVSSDSSNTTIKAYIDGDLDNTTTSTTTLNEVTGSMIAYLGALQTTPSGNTFFGASKEGDAPLSASMDEFRYWKSVRTEKDIKQNWWTHVRGGSNKEIANAELGVYYKFNEGITGTSSIDAVVLDYSGRISNGDWIGYPGSAARNTGSAIVSASAAAREFRDPIIYSTHDDVKSVLDELSTSGSVYDYENQASIFDSVPGWIVDEEDEAGSNELERLTQIMGSYFDTLNLQIKSLPHLRDNTYHSSSAKPSPFMRKLISSTGMATPDIFVDADLLERFGNQSLNEEYSMDLDEVKNLIYKNIYNNLIYIYKSKGTEKAFRNLIRAYGIGDEIVKFNAYGNNTTFKFEDTTYETTVRKNYIDFNSPARFDGVVYQNTSSDNSETTNGPVTFVSGTSKQLANTAEIEAVFPLRFEFGNPGYFEYNFLSSSIFGYQKAAESPSNFDQDADASNYNFVLYAVRTAKNSKDVYFQLRSTAGDFNLTSSIYSNVYDNQKWNFAIRFKDKYYPYSDAITGSADDDVIMEWYGVNVELGVVKNDFLITKTGLKDEYLTDRRRYFMGAHRTDYTGSLLTPTDTKLSSLRHWNSYLDNDVIVAHAKDPENTGTRHPSRNLLFLGNTDSSLGENSQILNAESLTFHWDFAQVTGSDADGYFTVEDASSGSVSLRSRYTDVGNTSHIIGNQYSGQGYFPAAASSAEVVDKLYVPSARQRLPEVVNTSDAVNVLSQDDEIFPRDAAVSQTFYAFEKSMYGIVSQEMINMFGTIVEFNNLIGDVKNKYREEYKDLRLLRTLFFEKIQNNPDLDKFIDYFKWIDSSISIFLNQLVPASANVSDEIRVMVEDYVLGRSKYRHQYPNLDYKGNDRWGSDESVLEVGVGGIEELTYNWKFGHAPLNNLESNSARWWKERASRSNSNFTTSTTIDSARQDINDIILSFNSASAPKLNDGTGQNGVYEGSTYALRRFTTPVKVVADMPLQLGGGYNYNKNQKPDALFSITRRGSTTHRYNASKASFRDVDVAELGPPIMQIKRRHLGQLLTDNLDSNSYATNKFGAPFAIYSASGPDDPTGYRAHTNGNEYAGIHSDAYGDDYEVPMQGPFTNEHVGGNRHRHIDLNTGSSPDTESTRPDAWYFAAGTFRANDATFARPSTSPQYRRDEVAKRPLNIKNIQHTTASAKAGNFSKIYQVVQTSDRLTNKSEFVKNEGFTTASVTTTPGAIVEGLVDYTKPSRTRIEHVFVERFSAPGGPDVAGDNRGGPGLDYVSAQYSPYNSLNYRNLTVRQPLQTLLTERSDKYGLRSGSATKDLAADYTTNYTASFHKTNRNFLKRLKFEDSSGGSFLNVVTKSVADNYYVQHMIPRSDYQYAWITASYESTNTDILGYFPCDGYISGNIGALNFVSSSVIGTGHGTANRRLYLEGYPAGTFVPTTFVGLNTTIVEPISGAAFTVGYPLDYTVFHYYNWGDIGNVTVNTIQKGSFVEKVGQSAAATMAHQQGLNHIINHRNGPYGHPTWKQIRVGQTALPRHYRRNNLYTHTPDGGDTITVTKNVVAGDGNTDVFKAKYGQTLIASQSVVTTKFYPIVHKLDIRAGEDQRGNTLTSSVAIETSFANNLVSFDDTNFANAIGMGDKITRRQKNSSYKKLLSLYAGRALDDETSPVQSVRNIFYREVVWPSLANMHSKTIRGRTNYDNNFWRADRTDRSTKGDLKKPHNSAGFNLTQSCWALDAAESFVSRVGFPSIPKATGIATASAEGRRAGELQNSYVQFHSASVTNAAPGVLYARKHIFPLTGSVTPAWGMLNSELVASTSDPNVLRVSSIATGEALWEAGQQAGRYEGTASVFATSSVSPFYDSYESYFSDIKAKGQSYGIIPEFRLADHIEFYKQSGDDFFAQNDSLFRIVGCPSGSGVPQNSSEQDFFKVFTNSDFLKYFEVVKNDHNYDGAPRPKSIQLKCRGIKKFLPYDGFYPAERTIQMAQQFMRDYTGSVAVVTASNLPGDATAEATDAYFRTLLKPLMAPGILYNTIKSGIAVDYPILTGSKAKMFKTYGPFTDSADDLFVADCSKAIFSTNYIGSRRAVAGQVRHYQWDNRVPFEALVEPEKYLADITIADDEPSNLCRIDNVVSWNPTGKTSYKEMMNNFLAESIHFFLKGSKTSAIRSKPQKRWKKVTPGQPYGMRVKMYRSMDLPKVASGSWGDFRLPQNSRVDLVAGTINPFTGEPVNSLTLIKPRETLTMYSRPSAFGPPLGLIRSGSSTHFTGGDNPTVAGSRYDFGPENGIYASHTPPYYDGECWFDIIYYPKGLETQDHDGVHIFRYNDEEDGTPYRPTLDEIFAPVNDTLFFQSGTAEAPLPLQGHITRKWRIDQQELRNDQPDLNGKDKLNSTYWLTTVQGAGTTVKIGPAAGPFINAHSMHCDASLNIFQKSRSGEEDRDKRWSIQSKFETPILNFNHVGTGSSTLTVTDHVGSNSCISKGMWHQFGRLPRGDEGVYIQVEDIPSDWLEQHPSATILHDMAGDFQYYRFKSAFVRNYAEANTYYGGYTVPVGSGSAYEKPVMGSLVDVCGFNTDPVRMGEIKANKRIHEAIVAVPFVEVGGERKFLETFTGVFGDVGGQSYQRLKRLMKKYVFPPTFDFVQNDGQGTPSVPAVAMYVFEFSHRLDRDDLSHIWQNLPPRIGVQAQTATAKIRHPLLINELLGDQDLAIQESLDGVAPYHTGLPEKLQWMVFKVKQRAKTDYYTELDGRESVMPFYSYNWPYDYFSLVELAQIEVGVNFGQITERVEPEPASGTTGILEDEGLEVAIVRNETTTPRSRPTATGAPTLGDD